MMGETFRHTHTHTTALTGQSGLQNYRTTGLRTVGLQDDRTTELLLQDYGLQDFGLRDYRLVSLVLGFGLTWLSTTAGLSRTDLAQLR